MIRRHGIRTVVNLRGCGIGVEWYNEECRATVAMDVSQEDLCFSAGRLPSVYEMRRLVEVIDRSEYPILLHCQRGADRTGLAAAVVLMLSTDVPYEQARRQLDLRYGHVPLGRPANLDRFFTLYQEWLQEHAWKHSRDHFRQWAVHDYCPAECWATLEPLDMPSVVWVGEPFACRVRCRNTSIKPWRLRSGPVGVHLLGSLNDARGRTMVMEQAGLFDAQVAPGESIDLTLAMVVPLPPDLPGFYASTLGTLNAPFGEGPVPGTCALIAGRARLAGSYTLALDMEAAQHCCFAQVGSAFLQWELEIREKKPPVDGQHPAAGVAGLADRLAPGR